MVQIEFQGSRLHRRAARLIPDKHECIQVAQLQAAWYTAMTFCNSASFLHCGRTQARNLLGTPGGKGFMRGGQIFKLCPIVSKHVQHIFPVGGKFFLGGFSQSGYGPVDFYTSQKKFS